MKYICCFFFNASSRHLIMMCTFVPHVCTFQNEDLRQTMALLWLASWAWLEMHDMSPNLYSRNCLEMHAISPNLYPRNCLEMHAISPNLYPRNCFHPECLALSCQWVRDLRSVAVHMHAYMYICLNIVASNFTWYKDPWAYLVIRKLWLSFF